MDVQVAKERILPAGEWEVSGRRGNSNVHADHSNLNAAAVFAHSRAVFGKDGSTIAARIAVDERNRFIERVDVHHRKHGAKNLVARGAHIRLHFIQNRRTNKVAARWRVLWVTAIDEQFCS